LQREGKGVERRMGRERREWRNIGIWEEMQGGCNSPKIISSREETGANRSFKRSCEKLVHISGGRKIDAMLPRG